MLKESDAKMDYERVWLRNKNDALLSRPSMVRKTRHNDNENDVLLIQRHMNVKD